MNRKTAVVTVTVVVLALGVAAAGYAIAGADDTGKQGRRSATLPPATATVERGDLSNTMQVDGTIGYPQERSLNAGASGTLTWIAAPAAMIKRDAVLYKVDENPVRAWYGNLPMYRTVKNGDKGKDVEMLERNLKALGHAAGLTVDRTFTAATARAVRRWQRHHKLTETGTVGIDQVAIIDGPIRVKKAAVTVGNRATTGEAILTASGVEHVVRFSLDASRASMAKVGATVTVELPAGDTQKARISWISPTAEKGKGGNGGEGGENSDPQVAINAKMNVGKGAAGDESPVTVQLTSQTRRNVLSVPVNALLALAGSGFGVQVVENGTTRDVPVKLGIFGDGRVEVSGAGLAEGATVGVPAS